MIPGGSDSADVRGLINVDFAEEEVRLHGELMDAASDLFVPLMWIPIICIPVILFFASRWRVYQEFPNVLFKWVLLNDWCYSVFLGPFRWLRGNPLYESMAYPTTPTGCRWSVFGDSMFQLSGVFINTIIVASVFDLVFFRTAKGAVAGSSNAVGGRSGLGCSAIPKPVLEEMTRIVLLVFCLTISIPAATAGPLQSSVPWCGASSIGILAKEAFWCLLLVVQIVLLIPTNYAVWKTSMLTRQHRDKRTRAAAAAAQQQHRKQQHDAGTGNDGSGTDTAPNPSPPTNPNANPNANANGAVGPGERPPQTSVATERMQNRISAGTYVRFIGIIVSQVIGLGSVLTQEFMHLTRKPLNSSLITWWAVGLPLAHMIDCLLLGSKVFFDRPRANANARDDWNCCRSFIANNFRGGSTASSTFPPTAPNAGTGAAPAAAAGGGGGGGESVVMTVAEGSLITRKRASQTGTIIHGDEGMVIVAPMRARALGREREAADDVFADERDDALERNDIKPEARTPLPRAAFVLGVDGKHPMEMTAYRPAPLVQLPTAPPPTTQTQIAVSAAAGAPAPANQPTNLNPLRLSETTPATGPAVPPAVVVAAPSVDSSPLDTGDRRGVMGAAAARLAALAASQMNGGSSLGISPTNASRMLQPAVLDSRIDYNVSRTDAVGGSTLGPDAVSPTANSIAPRGTIPFRPKPAQSSQHLMLPGQAASASPLAGTEVSPPPPAVAGAAAGANLPIGDLNSNVPIANADGTIPAPAPAVVHFAKESDDGSPAGGDVVTPLDPGNTNPATADGSPLGASPLPPARATASVVQRIVAPTPPRLRANPQPQYVQQPITEAMAVGLPPSNPITPIPKTGFQFSGTSSPVAATTPPVDPSQHAGHAGHAGPVAATTPPVDPSQHAGHAGHAGPVAPLSPVAGVGLGLDAEEQLRRHMRKLHFAIRSERLPVWLQLVLLLIVPVCLVAVTTGINMAAELSTRRASTRASDTVALASYSSELSHELARERGSSALFVSTNGTEFGPFLLNQRTRVDPLITQFQRFLWDSPSVDTDPVVVAGLSALLLVLPAVRENVTSVPPRIDVPHVLAYYNSVLNELLSLEYAVGKETEAGVQSVFAYTCFVAMKAASEWTHTLGSMAFAESNGFNHSLAAYREFVGSDEREGVLRRAFVTLGPTATVSTFIASLNDSALTPYRNALYTNYTDYPFAFASVRARTSSDWNAVATRKQSFLYDTGFRLRHELALTAQAAVTESTDNLLKLLFVLLGLLCMIGAGVFNLTGITQAMTVLDERTRHKTYLCNRRCSFPFRYQLGLGVGLPVLVLIAQSLLLIDVQVTASQHAASEFVNTELAAFIGVFLQHAQTECTLTGYYGVLNAQPALTPASNQTLTDARAELIAQYAVTDAAAAQLQHFLATAYFEPAILASKPVRDGFAALQSLPAQRAAALAASVDVWSSVLFYRAELIDNFVRTIRESTRAGGYGSTDFAILSYVSFTGLKDQLGLVRGSGSSIIGASGYAYPSLVAYQSYARALAAARTFRENFDTYSIDSQRDAYAQLRSSAAANITAKFSAALLSYDNSLIAPLTTDEWWFNVTSFIDDARTLELELIGYLSDRINTSIDETTLHVGGFAATLAFLFLLNVWLCTLTIRHVLALLSVDAGKRPAQLKPGAVPAVPVAGVGTGATSGGGTGRGESQNRASLAAEQIVASARLSIPTIGTGQETDMTRNQTDNAIGNGSTIGGGDDMLISQAGTGTGLGVGLPPPIADQTYTRQSQGGDEQISQFIAGALPPPQ